MHDYQRMLPGKEDGCYGTMTEVFKDKPKGSRFSDAATLIRCSQSHAEYCWCVAVVMRRRAPINPLTEMIESKENVCCMLPLMSGRRLVARVGSGPMKSAFHYSNHLEFNKQILHPAFAKLGIVERMKGCATRVLRASAMCFCAQTDVGGSELSAQTSCRISSLYTAYHSCAATLFDRFTAYRIRDLTCPSPAT